MKKIEILDQENKDKINKKVFNIFLATAFLFLLFGFALGMNEESRLFAGSFMTGNSISELQNKLENLNDKIGENEELINQLENSELKEQDLVNQLEKLKLQNIELREGMIEIINKIYEEISNQECVVSKTSSSSSSCSCPEVEEDEGEIEVCELTSDDCGENQYLDASICMCIDRRPPIDDLKITVSA